MKEEEKTIWQPTELHLAEGDILTSKKGILQQSPITKEYFIMKKGKYIDKGYWEAIIKEPIDVNPVKEIEDSR